MHALQETCRELAEVDLSPFPHFPCCLERPLPAEKGSGEGGVAVEASRLVGVAVEASRGGWGWQ